MTELKMPSVLSFDRKLEPSDAVMHSGNWTDIDKASKWSAIKLFDRRNRAVFSNFTKEELDNEVLLKDKMGKPNLSWGDDASLPFDQDTLKLSFSLRVLGGIKEPSACNSRAYQDKFTDVISEYISEFGAAELANRYAYNIANGRFLWRNRVGAQDIAIYVKHPSLSEALVFDAYDYPLKNTTAANENVIILAQLIELGLTDRENVLIEIEAYVNIGKGQRVWPSQDMVLNIPKGDKSRHLFSLNVNGEAIAAMHCEKIGNALRTIDDWQTDLEQPIAIEAFGSVTQRGVACRSSRNDFKTLITKWMTDKDISIEDKHFVIAMIIRGGVFSDGDK
ncbi:type I-F CRISPR-associated protein Csy3 [Moritella sp. 5]|uniref:type I-F CRISPR-associated protein Csy3 n=1 Tax=Moritella sp. 5 TaxID=2746231 RepID=UPI001BA63325|nr:type I-F CRISPR-associated protein Csy3 [Moritella sp. 5]QUM81129.1 type I-F CRISPR-associated protein Csy3 [Moritella sp. 5]